MNNKPAQEAKNCTEIERNTARFGKFFTRRRVKAALSIDGTQLDDLVGEHRLLAVVTSERTQLFPAFQFDLETEHVRPQLQKLISILLASGADGWTVVYWLTAPLPEYGDRRAIDIADVNPDAFTALEAWAREDAARWAR